MKSFTIEFDTDGSVKTSLKGYEAESPKLAAIVEAVTGRTDKVDWNPKAHAHVTVGGKVVTHSH